MARVFLSYDRDDAERARQVAQALERAGHDVWWDLHVRGGAQFSKVIEEALRAADVVVVLWSVRSVESPWVRDEAAFGRDRKSFVPITIDGTEPPLGFRQFQTIDLSNWSGRRTSVRLQDILTAIDGSASERPQRLTNRVATSTHSLPEMSRPILLALITAVVFVAIAVERTNLSGHWKPLILNLI